MFRRGSLSRALLIIVILLGSQFPLSPINAQTKLTVAEAKSWFCNGTKDIGNLSITVPTTRGTLPSVDVPADPSCGNRPALTFKLLSAFAEGLPSIGVRDKVWYTFEAYRSDGVTRVEPIYLSISDGEDSNFIYGQDVDPALKKGKYQSGSSSACPEKEGGINCELTRASTDGPSGELLKKSIRELSARTNNFPVGDDSCEAPSTNNDEDPVQLVGPKSSSTNSQGTTDPTVGPPTAPNSTGSTTSSSTGQNDYESLNETDRFRDGKEHPNVLNRDCLADHAGGWLKAWGITDENISIAQGILEGDCAINKIVAGGLGSAVGTLTACLVSVILTGMLEWAAKWVQEAAGLSWRPGQGSGLISYHQSYK